MASIFAHFTSAGLYFLSSHLPCLIASTFSLATYLLSCYLPSLLASTVSSCDTRLSLPPPFHLAFPLSPSLPTLVSALDPSGQTR
mmetsp:Transcript_54356/g.107943  ORF Transcript_54356/g.107943 Transcript_54356/m.107943 type:complete len:85 (+) Transcript_54356:2-256(+)